MYTARRKQRNFGLFWCVHTFFSMYTDVHSVHREHFFLFLVCTLCICVYMRFFSCTHGKTTHFLDFFAGVYIVYMFSYVLKTGAGIKQPTQNTVMIFVQLYFEIGVDFLADINYNILGGRQKVEVMK